MGVKRFKKQSFSGILHAIFANDFFDGSGQTWSCLKHLGWSSIETHCMGAVQNSASLFARGPPAPGLWLGRLETQVR